MGRGPGAPPALSEAQGACAYACACARVCARARGRVGLRRCTGCRDALSAVCTCVRSVRPMGLPRSMRDRRHTNPA
nr:MAG TPA: hypothetical protein [Caudoviricetes sp.]